MNHFMHYLYCRDIQQSVDFYVSLGFFIYFDSQDGLKVCHARLSHPDCVNMLIALKDFLELLALSDKLTTIDNHPLKLAFTIVTDDYFIWQDKFAEASAKQSTQHYRAVRDLLSGSIWQPDLHI